MHMAFPAKSDRATLAAHLFLLVALQYVYLIGVVPLYGYLGFRAHFDPVRAAIAIVSLPCLLTLIPSARPIPRYFGHFAVISIVTPTLTLFACGAGSWAHLGVTVSCFATVCIVSRVAKVPAPRILSLRPPIVLLSAVLMSGLVVAIVAMGVGGRINFDLNEVYDLRAEFADDSRGLMSYIQVIASKALLPLAVALACIYRQPLVIAALCLMGLLLFGFTTHKSMALFPVLAAGVYWLAGRHQRISWAITGLAALILISTLTKGWLLGLLPRRGLLTPVQLNSYYIEHFSSNPTFYWSTSRITFDLIDPPGDLSPPDLIGYMYHGYIHSANTGWIGSGFAQAGLMGALLYSALLGIVFAFFDDCAKRLGHRLVLASASVPVLAALTSTDLITAFITHGLAFTTIALSVIGPAPSLFRRPKRLRLAFAGEGPLSALPASHHRFQVRGSRN